MEILSRELVAGFTVLHVILAVVAVGGVLFALQFILGGRKQKESHLRQASCASCGWRGNISQLVKKCPKCNGAL